MSNIFNLEGLLSDWQKNTFLLLSCPNAKSACNTDVIIAKTAFTTSTTSWGKEKPYNCYLLEHMKKISQGQSLKNLQRMKTKMLQKNKKCLLSHFQPNVKY